ncbi:uncharacterized protein LOC105839421 [Monomorium pharaonis]|uniref:uncharacterized protein LOC105839421 n=1 Tax=Monomorium pharaonis TaxID=307658 RepID=UPI00063FA3A9|nr:uncharacterized protein LOC105839421 [Monomorium pharaonis]
MTTMRTLFFLGVAFTAFAEIRAVPARYDQRQTGDFNLAAKLENLLFVVVFPSNTDKFGDLASTALEAAALLGRSKEGSIKSDEAVRQEEPYSVEIISVNHLDKENSVRKVEGNVETSNVSDQRSTFVENKKAEKAERIARNVKNFDFPKSREALPIVPGYFVNVRKTSGPKTGNDGRAWTVVENAWYPDDEAEQLGMPLRKQLPQERKKNIASLPSSSADKNDVSPSFAEEKHDELILLGGGIENCGPGGRRDASGICQFDGSTTSAV